MSYENYFVCDKCKNKSETGETNIDRFGYVNIGLCKNCSILLFNWIGVMPKKIGDGYY